MDSLLSSKNKRVWIQKKFWWKFLLAFHISLWQEKKWLNYLSHIWNGNNLNNFISLRKLFNEYLVWKWSSCHEKV
jgi:hypothetical protein